MSAHEDESDVEQVLAGNVAAFERIVGRWQGPLVNLAYRFFRDRARAEDMAQEAFLRAYRNLKGWRRDAAFSTWLFALATNLYRSELRRLGARNVVSLELIDEQLARRSWDGAVERFETEHRDRAIRRAVLTLPPKYRDALTLFYFHDMDVAAAAASLDVPEGTIKARLSRARTMLRDKLRRILGTPEAT